MDKLLNKTFFKFLVRFIIIVTIGIAGVLIAGLIGDLKDTERATPTQLNEN